MVGTQERAQTAFDEAPLEDPSLEATLKAWQEAKDELKPYRLAFAAVNKTAKELIKQKELEDGTYRCGAFVVSITKAESQTIEFERAESRSIRIKRAKT